MTYKTTDTCGENSYDCLRAFACHSQKQLVLFGAGVSGEYISHYLMFAGHEIAFFVDNNSTRIGNEVNGIAIRPVTDLHPTQHCVVITSERYADEILLQLMQLGLVRSNIHVLRQSEIQTTFDSDPMWPDYAIKNYSIPFLKRYFDAKQIEYSSDVISKPPFCFINPFFANGNYQKGFFAAYLDYVLPSLCDDWSMVVEGPGEFGEVSVNLGDVVIDCGANVGLFSAIAAARGGIVHAFEPIPECYSQLLKTAALFDNIRCWPLAISNETGFVRMSFPEEGANTGGSFVLAAGNNIIDVEATTIDRFIESNDIQRCDFIKADIEGAERFMLLGAVDTLRNHAPKLSICTYHLPDDREVLESIILGANPAYVVEHRWQKLYAYVPEK